MLTQVILLVLRPWQLLAPVPAADCNCYSNPRLCVCVCVCLQTLKRHVDVAVHSFSASHASCSGKLQPWLSIKLSPAHCVRHSSCSSNGRADPPQDIQHLKLQKLKNFCALWLCRRLTMGPALAAISPRTLNILNQKNRKCLCPLALQAADNKACSGSSFPPRHYTYQIKYTKWTKNESFCSLWLCRRLTMGLALGASQEISRGKAFGEPPPASQQMAPRVLTHLVQQPLRSRLSRGSRIYSRKQVRKDKIMPFGVNLMRSQVLYRAAQVQKAGNSLLQTHMHIELAMAAAQIPTSACHMLKA